MSAKKQLILTPSSTSMNKTLNDVINEMKTDINELSNNLKSLVETINNIEVKIDDIDNETTSVLKNHAECIKQIAKTVNIDFNE